MQKMIGMNKNIFAKLDQANVQNQSSDKELSDFDTSSNNFPKNTYQLQDNL